MNQFPKNFTWGAAAMCLGKGQVGEGGAKRWGVGERMWWIQLCGRSHEHVTRSFQKHLSMTPTQWLTQERIRLAGRLLETTRMSILEIAHECGFESPSHFHSRFKIANGSTPLQYRKRAAGVQSPLPGGNS